ncbi:MAG: DUF1385 domain-containing protein [Rubrobacteraceae bacterium]
MAEKSEKKTGQEIVPDPMTFGGMARFDGLDLFGPHFMSVAYKKRGDIHVNVEPSRINPPKNETALALSRLPIIRSFFFWGRLIWQVGGSLWTLLFIAATLAVLWLVVSLFEFGSGTGGAAGGLFEFLAIFPILPVLLLFFLVMRFTSIGRFHGAEHKVVVAYERYGEVTMQNARVSSRLHPRCGTNILVYILAAGLLDPLFGSWIYAILQFILISEAWFLFGQSKISIAVGNFFQKHFTTTEPRRAELEVAVESMNRLLAAEKGETGGIVATVPARF